MALEHFGVHVEHRTNEVAESQDIVALRSIHWDLTCLVGIVILVLYDTLILSEFLQYRTGSAVRTRASTDTE
jgi:hypothetical protein